MNPILSLIICLLGNLFTACGCFTGSANGNSSTISKNRNQHHSLTLPLPETQIPSCIFTLIDAERILGEPAVLTDSSFSNLDHKITLNKAYSTLDSVVTANSAGNIYFMYERFEKVTEAERLYRSIFNSNATHEGITVLNALGDEAYYHSDDRNFYFILVRKSNMMIRMKVNKITNSTSKQNFMDIAFHITKSL